MQEDDLLLFFVQFLADLIWGSDIYKMRVIILHYDEGWRRLCIRFWGSRIDKIEKKVKKTKKNNNTR